MFKQKNIRGQLLFYLLLCCPFGLTGQKGFLPLPAQKQVYVPFELINNLVVCELNFEHIPHLKFIIDTGVSNTIFLYPELLIMFAQKAKKNIKIRGLGSGDEIDAVLMHNISLSIAEVRAQNLDVIVLNNELLGLDRFLGEKIYGILGYDFFKNYRVHIDYANKMLTIENADNPFKPQRRKMQAFDLQIEHKKPYFTADIFQGNEYFRQKKIFIDTGSSLALSIMPSPEEKMNVPQPNIHAYLGAGISGDLAGEIARIDSFLLGNYHFFDLITAFPDSMSIQHLQLNDHRFAAVGGEVLRRFTLIMDYPHRKMYLKSNKNYKEEFSYNKSGMFLMQSDSIPNQIEVYRVDSLSPAAEAGVLPGDIIWKYNGIGGDLSLNKIMADLTNLKAGKRIKLQLKRKEEFHKVQFFLKDLL